MDKNTFFFKKKKIWSLTDNIFKKENGNLKKPMAEAVTTENLT